MFEITRRIDKFLLFFVALTIAGSAIGCDWIPESTFELASESRLPKWITLPPGLTRADVSIKMSYYVKPWGRSATFILQDMKGKIRTKVNGKEKGLEPFQLKHPPLGFPPGYPSYEVITVNGIIEIIEHRKPEPTFYITDDPAVWKELGVGQSSGSWPTLSLISTPEGGPLLSRLLRQGGFFDFLHHRRTEHAYGMVL